jgi:hypothetical protein
MEAAPESQRTSLGRILAKEKGNAGAWVSVVLALAAGLGLRLWMLAAFPQVEGDTLVYGDLAKNLLHGKFALTDGSGVLHSTLIRLPGYPLFLALCFRLFGVDNYTSAACAQIALELTGCLLLAGFVRRVASPQAALCALWLSALCPFTASYAVAPLTETPTLFVIALALWALAPRYANEPGESSNPGWQRWVKTWCLDFVSTYDIYWNVPGSPLDITKLPSRAFDSPQQYAETVDLAKAYAENGQDISPELDARFWRLAEERVRAHPLRFYLWLPLGRMADMWLRPRVENLPIDLDWWVYAHHNQETEISWAYAGLNALYLLLGLAGMWLRPRYWQWMAAYMIMRSLLLTTIEGPEARYTLECFPMLFALGGIAVSATVRRARNREQETGKRGRIPPLPDH